MANALANPLVPVLWVAALHLAAYTLGRPLASWTRSVRSLAGPQPGASLHALLLGFASLSWLGFALAATHLLVPAWMCGLVVALALPSALRFARHGRAVRRFGATWRPGWDHLPAVLALLFFLQFIPRALSPVLQQDDLVYHLFLPKAYLEAHGFVSLPWHVNANMPHLVEVLYAWPLAIGDFTSPKLLVLSFALLALAGLWSFAVPRSGRFAAGLLLLVYLSGSNVQWHLGIGHVELVLGAYLLAALVSVADWRQQGGRGHLLRIGAYCGFAAAAKYTGWVFAATIVLGLGVALVRAAGPRRARLRWLGIAIGVAFLFVLPWLVKNAATTGNPLYPNLYTLFDGKGWSEVQEHHFRLAMRTVEGAGPAWTWKDYAAMPWRLPFANNDYSCPSFSILVMLLFLAALVRPGPGGRWLGLVALLGCVGWALSAPQGRYLVAWVPAMCLALSGVLAHLRGRTRRWQALALGIVLAASAVQMVVSKERPSPGWGALAGRRTAVRENPGYALCQSLNETVPPGGRVLGLWENRFFFLERGFEADAVWQVPWVLARLRQLDDPARLAAALQLEGITHVVVRAAGLESYFANNYAYDLTDPRWYPRAQFERDRVLVIRFIGEQLTYIANQGVHSIYRLQPPPRPARVPGPGG